MLYDQRTNTLVYRPQDPLKLAAAVPQARSLADGYVGVPATLPNLQLLRKADYPVIEPLRNYDWPAGTSRSRPSG